VAPVYPWLYTGAIDPLLWRPIPGVQTLNFVPFRVDLTPFAGLLSDGNPHQVGVNVYNANHYFLVAATLLLYLDSGSTQVTGAVTQNTLAAPEPAAIREDLTTGTDGSVTGKVRTRAERRFTIAGYVNTSHGRVETKLKQTINFSNEQRFVISDTEFTQNISQTTQITAATETKGAHSVTHTERHDAWPLDLDISQVLADDGSIAQTTSVDQSFETKVTQGAGGAPHHTQTSNNVTTTDTLLFNSSGALTGFRDRTSAQSYDARNTDGYCYSRSIAAANGLLTSVEDGHGCGHR
jgi:hypothetical protein